jgi:hypothetical protein
MNNYLCYYDYIRASKNKLEKIKRVKAIIEAMEDSMLQGAVKSDLEEYVLDTGQSRIKTILRNPSEITRTLSDLNKYLNALTKSSVGFQYKLKPNHGCI